MRLMLVILLTLCGAFGSVCTAEVTPYPRLPVDVANQEFPSVSVNGVPVESATTPMRVGYAHFAADEPVDIEIVVCEPVQSVDLSPHRLNVPVRVDGNTIRFRLEHPTKVHLQVNDLPRFFVFADAPERDAPTAQGDGVIDAATFGLIDSPDLTQTDVLQRAINDSARAGRTLRVGPGLYRTGRLLIPSNTSLYLAAGAMIRGTDAVADFPKTDGSAQLLHIVDATNVRIFGRGAIDGNGITLRRLNNNARESKAKLITTLRSRNIRIDDVLLRESGVWCMHMVESSDITVSGVKLISLARSEAPPEADQMGVFYGGNADGFDPDNSSRVTIQDCFISCDDDAIAVKLRNGTRRDMSDITFQRNVIFTTCSALKIGTEIHDKVLSGVRFLDNDIVHADVGIAIWCWRGGTVDGVLFRGNYFERIGAIVNESPHKKTTPIRITILNVNNDGAGQIRNVLIEDNTFERAGPATALLEGLDADHVVRDVNFVNLVIGGQKVLDADGSIIKCGPFTANVTFE